MSWRVVVRPEVERDMAEAAAWYDSQQAGLGGEFREEVIQVFDVVVAKSAASFPSSSPQGHPLALSRPFSLPRDL